MKRYLVFRGSVYYPRGGWEDFAGWADTFEEAETLIKSLRQDWEKDEPGRFDWYHVVDTTLWKIVWENA